MALVTCTARDADSTRLFFVRALSALFHSEQEHVVAAWQCRSVYRWVRPSSERLESENTPENQTSVFPRIELVKTLRAFYRRATRKPGRELFCQLLSNLVEDRNMR